MRNRPTLSLVLPCYNEGKIIFDDVYAIVAALDLSRMSYEIIFVDDYSTDDTQIHIAQLCKKFPHTRGLYHTKNQGRGSAVSDGMHASKGNIVGFIDIDCEVSPVYIPHIVELIARGKADMIIGERVYRTTAVSLLREVLSSGYRRIASKLLGTHGLDTESGYKFFRKSKLLPLLSLIVDQHWFWDTEIVVWAIRKQLRIMQYPVLFIRKLNKESTVRIIPDTIAYIRQIIRFHSVLINTP